MVRIATSFTIAHSITLALATLSLPVRPARAQSAPAEVLYREFGITAEAVAVAALRCIARTKMAAAHA